METFVVGRNVDGKKTEKKNIGKKFLQIKKGSMKVLIVALAIFVISAILVLSVQFNAEYITLTVPFSSISQGHNPDGSPFDIQEVLSDEVLADACQKLNGRIDVKTLKKHLSVSGNTSEADLAKVKQNILDGNEEYASIPTVYILKYSTVSEQIQSEGFFSSCGAFFGQLILPGKHDILTAVAESYSEFYTRKYVVMGDALTPDWTLADNLDYYNRGSAVASTAGRMSRFLQKKYDQSVDYVSAKKGMGYGELYVELNNVISVDIENYNSYVIQNGLTTDNDRLLKQFRFMEADSAETNERQLARYGVIKGAIDFYDSNVTKVVFIPALDYDDSFYMNRTKVGMDYLVENATTAKVNADDAEHNKINYQHLIGKFGNNASADVEKYNKANAMYSDIKQKVDNIALSASEIIEEEIGTSNFEKIKVGTAYSGFSLVSAGISGAKTFAFLAIIAYLAFWVVDFITKKRRI